MLNSYVCYLLFRSAKDPAASSRNWKNSLLSILNCCFFLVDVALCHGLNPADNPATLSLWEAKDTTKG